jgi:hypothetical protein
MAIPATNVKDKTIMSESWRAFEGGGKSFLSM